MKLKDISKSWYYLFAVIIIYLILFFYNKILFLSSLNFFLNILKNIIPVFLLIFVLMTLTNYFITPSFLIKHFKKGKIKKWLFIIIGGILSTGPIYMWYPLLADLKNKGLSYGLIACFLYNRAIKIPLLPLMIFYFNLKYVAILMAVMIFASIIQGILIDKLMKET